MTEHRVFVDAELAEGGLVELPQPVHHHLVVVLRRIRGDSVTLFNGRGGEYPAVLEALGKKTAMARVTGRREVERESPLAITLAQAVSKGDRMDYAIQKAVELGVHAVVPLITDRCVVRLSDERWERKQEHWQAVATSACEQSGRTRVPAVHKAVDLRDWVSTCPADALKLVLSPGLEPHAGGLSARPSSAVLLVGPEGGLSEVELRLADLAGFVGLPLGPRVLRTETAGVVALSVLQALWGDLGSAFQLGN